MTEWKDRRRDVVAADESGSDLQYEEALNTHYGSPDLGEELLAALRAAGKDVEGLGREDIASFDEFHIRGLEATREVADLAGIQSGDRVLDVGCGVGGPARTLAAEYGCSVVGIDLVMEYCRAARLFTDLVGLDDSVEFRQGNALDLEFEDDAFDAVWFEHVLMNVEEKPRVFGEAARVLGPGGKLVVYDICAGGGGDALYPVPWASDASLSHLETPERLRETLVGSGFGEVEWRDVTGESLEWFRGVVESMESRPPDAPPPLGLNLLMGAEAPAKIENVVRCLEEDRIEVVQGVFRLEE